MVKIDHGNGIETLYCHCSELYVSEGVTVRKGEIIAAVGQTGLVTGPHLHFEIRKNGSTVNPINYLPSTRGVIFVDSVYPESCLGQTVAYQFHSVQPAFLGSKREHEEYPLLRRL